MRNIILTFLILISTTTLSQTKIDELISITFPEKHKTLDTVMNSEKVNINYLNNEIEGFSLTKIKVDSKEDPLNDLPYNKTSLDSLYKGFMHGQRSKMEENGYKFIDWKELEVDGFNAYKTIYVDSETQIKNAEFVTLILEENSYVAGYISHIDFDENRKEKFLNSILVNKENSPSQYIGEPQAYKRGYVFGKYAFRISLFILVIWGIRRLFKK